ncbi:hypothetical protein PAMP_018191 [Pampus punctatissimus]
MTHFLRLNFHRSSAAHFWLVLFSLMFTCCRFVPADRLITDRQINTTTTAMARADTFQSYLVPYPHPDSQDEPRTHQHLFVLSPPPWPSSSERSRGTVQQRSAFSGDGEQSAKQLLWLPGVAVSMATRVVVATGTQLLAGNRGHFIDVIGPNLDREEHQEASRQQGPLPDLLPQSEHPSRAARGEAVQELEVRPLADQLRAIADEFNTTVLQRADAVPYWQDWRDVWRGLLNFIDQTISVLYRLT